MPPSTLHLSHITSTPSCSHHSLPQRLLSRYSLPQSTFWNHTPHPQIRNQSCLLVMMLNLYQCAKTSSLSHLVSDLESSTIFRTPTHCTTNKSQCIRVHAFGTSFDEPVVQVVILSLSKGHGKVEGFIVHRSQSNIYYLIRIHRY